MNLLPLKPLAVRPALSLMAAMAALLIAVALWCAPAHARNEVQTVTLNNVTASSVAITHADYSGSATFAPGATAAVVQSALEAKFGTGTVSVTAAAPPAVI